MSNGYRSSSWVCLKPGCLKDEFNTWFTLLVVGKSSSSCRCQQTLLQLLCLLWVLTASHNAFLVRKGRSGKRHGLSVIRQWHCLSGILCFILFPQSHRLPSDSAWHADSKYMVSFNFLWETFQNQQNVCEKIISVPWTSDGSDLICCPPGCLQQDGGNTGKALMEICEQNKAEATWLSCCPPVLLLCMLLPQEGCMLKKLWWGISPSDCTMVVPCMCFMGRITPEISWPFSKSKR